MKDVYERIFSLALPYLKSALKKDYVLHTKGVVKAMQLLLKHEEGDEDVLLPAAILHDVGWAKVPANLQGDVRDSEKTEAQRLHLEHAPEIILEILKLVDYPEEKIRDVISVVESHKFHEPQELNKRLLIDADCMSDAFKEQFYSDVESFKTNPETNYTFRMKNKFYTKTAEKIFTEELGKRKAEFEKAEN